jgi:hypothetical protein
MADHQQPSRNARIQRMNRRAFLQVAGLATGAIVLGGVYPVAAGQAPVQLQGTRISYFQWVNFVPAHDAALKNRSRSLRSKRARKSPSKPSP